MIVTKRIQWYTSGSECSTATYLLELLYKAVINVGKAPHQKALLLGMTRIPTRGVGILISTHHCFHEALIHFKRVGWDA